MSTMEELGELLEMTVKLAQVSSEVTIANKNLPWFSILEADGGQQCLAQTATSAKSGGGMAALLGQAHSNDSNTLMLS